MSLLSILMIAVGLSMDAFAVSISSGLAIKKLKLRHAFLMAGFFGGFQAIMPILGWMGGLGVSQFLMQYNRIVAFLLLAGIGAKMIYESFQIETAAEKNDTFKIPVLLFLATATSIDALAVGLSFAFLDINAIFPALIIGAVTFVFSMAGIYIGEKFGHLFEGKIEIAGGVILILIGLKILIYN